MDIEALIVRNGIAYVDALVYNPEQATLTIQFAHASSYNVYGTAIWTSVADFTCTYFDDLEQSQVEQGLYQDNLLGIIQTPVDDGYTVQVNTDAREIMFFTATLPQWISDE